MADIRTGPYMGHAPKFKQVTTVTGATPDLKAAHMGGVLLVSHSSGTTLKVHDDADMPDVQIGEWVLVVNYGVGAVTVAKDTDNNVRVDATYTLVLAGRYSAALLIKIAANEWLLTGSVDLVPA